MTEGERAVIFGRTADTYDSARPSYPKEAVDHVLGLTAIGDAVEIGAGTGKATVAFARPGLDIVCLEPDEEMAAVLEQRGLPGVRVERRTFEGWAGPELPVDLVYAAQAWHWLDPSTAYERAGDMLRPGGALALIWNVPEQRYEPFEEVYRRHAPEILAEQDERVRARDSSRWLEEIETASFDRPELFTHDWSVELSSAELRRLYSTYSDHMMVPEPRRGRLLDALENAVDSKGGSVAVRYQTRVFSGLAAR